MLCLLLRDGFILQSTSIATKRVEKKMEPVFFFLRGLFWSPLFIWPSWLEGKKKENTKQAKIPYQFTYMHLCTVLQGFDYVLHSVCKYQQIAHKVTSSSSSCSPEAKVLHNIVSIRVLRWRKEKTNNKSTVFCLFPKMLICSTVLFILEMGFFRWWSGFDDRLKKAEEGKEFTVN